MADILAARRRRIVRRQCCGSTSGALSCPIPRDSRGCERVAAASVMAHHRPSRAPRAGRSSVAFTIASLLAPACRPTRAAGPDRSRPKHWSGVLCVARLGAASGPIISHAGRHRSADHVVFRGCDAQSASEEPTGIGGPCRQADRCRNFFSNREEQQ